MKKIYLTNITNEKTAKKKISQIKKRIKKPKPLKNNKRFPITNIFTLKNSLQKTNLIFTINKNSHTKNKKKLPLSKIILLTKEKTKTIEPQNPQNQNNLKNYKTKEILEIIKQIPYFFSLKDLFKEFFKYKNISYSTLQSLNFFELRRLMDFLNLKMDKFLCIKKKKKYFKSFKI